jgi:hypothetical protein
MKAFSLRDSVGGSLHYNIDTSQVDPKSKVKLYCSATLLIDNTYKIMKDYKCPHWVRTIKYAKRLRDLRRGLKDTTARNANYYLQSQLYLTKAKGAHSLYITLPHCAPLPLIQNTFRLFQHSIPKCKLLDITFIPSASPFYLDRYQNRVLNSICELLRLNRDLEHIALREGIHNSFGRTPNETHVIRWGWDEAKMTEADLDRYASIVAKHKSFKEFNCSLKMTKDITEVKPFVKVFVNQLNLKKIKLRCWKNYNEEFAQYLFRSITKPLTLDLFHFCGDVVYAGECGELYYPHLLDFVGHV